ncbi:hypothetical protein [Sphingomonas hankookensis]
MSAAAASPLHAADSRAATSAAANDVPRTLRACPAAFSASMSAPGAA